MKERCKELEAENQEMLQREEGIWIFVHTLPDSTWAWR